MSSMTGTTQMPEPRKPRPKPKVMMLSDAAAERLKAIVAARGEGTAGLRVGVKNGGCAGMEYTMDWVEHADPLDERFEDKGVTLLIDKKAVLFLLGTVMDFKVETLKSGFVFENPNQTSACGCGESVTITPASTEALAG
jgi:iron-sulfur cluster assembly protein